MQILVHQAIYGELNGGWDLLATSTPDLQAAKDLRFQTDLPDRAPIGINWQPIVRGAASEKFYVIIKTYPDTSDNVRRGRVFSHCLLIDRKDLPRVSSISPLLRTFPEQIDKTIEIKPLVFDLEVDSPAKVDDHIRGRFKKGINGLAELGRFQNTIVWVGQDDFEGFVGGIWERLEETERLGLSFGLIFNPREVTDAPLNVIVVPAGLESNWLNTPYCVIRRTDSFELKTLHERYLYGDAVAISSINSFEVAFGIAKPGKDALPYIAKVVSTYSGMASSDFSSVNTLAHIVAEYSKDPRKGAKAKKAVTARLCELSRTAQARELIALRNFPTRSFAGSQRQLGDEVARWVRGSVLGDRGDRDIDFSELVPILAAENGSSWWSKTLLEEFRIFVSNVTRESAATIWRWLEDNLALIELLRKHIDRSAAAEDALLKSLPKKIDQKALGYAKELATESRWLNLHAVLLLKLTSFEEALSQHLRLDPTGENIDAVKVICSSVKPQRVIDRAVSTGENVLIAISAELCQSTPSLVRRLDVSEINWQKIWLRVIEDSDDPTLGISQPRKHIHKLLDRVVGDLPVEDGLLAIIGQSSFADILDYKHRAEVWSKLPLEVRSSFLKATASRVLGELSRNEAFEVPDDEQLRQFILDGELAGFLYFNRDKISVVLPIVSRFDGIPDGVIADYIHYYRGNLSAVEAVQLGSVVLHRGLWRSAKMIYERSERRSMFALALKECYELLGTWEKGKIAFFDLLDNVPFTEDMWWEAFQEAAYTLYQGGPRDRKIWMEAGGQEYDLLNVGTGKEIWIDALTQLRNGLSAGVTVKKLLTAMSKDYKNNDKLKMLKKLRSSI